MARSRFAPDRGLTARMLVTMFLLGLLYIVFVGFFFVFVPRLALIVLVIAGASCSASTGSPTRSPCSGCTGTSSRPSRRPSCTASSTGCAPGRHAEAAGGHRRRRRAQRLRHRPQPQHAVVCVTTGILRRLDEPELEAVLAHELSHVAHRDVAVMTIASFLGMVAGLMTRVMSLRGTLRRIRGRRRTTTTTRAARGPGGWSVIVVSAVVYAISFLLTMALSRYRELAADRSGAILIGRPSLLASALVKVTGEMSRIPTRDLRSAEHFNAFYFAPAIANGGSLSSLFSTHPSSAEALTLSKLEAELRT